MLTPFRELLEERRASRAAAGAFTCYTLATAIGVLRAAAFRRAPVILLLSEASYAASGGDVLLAALLQAGELAPTPVCVQLDHVSDPETMGRALYDGVGAVMADGSRLPYGQNVALVREARELAGAVAGVEAELGHVEGGEDVAAATAAGMLTEADEAVRFVKATQADCLAVSIGNVHGHYPEPPALDWARLEAIRELVDVPLSLHGASGLDDTDLRRAVGSGITKVNVNTELRERIFADLERRVVETRPGLRLLELETALADGVAAVAAAKLDVLSPT